MILNLSTRGRYCQGLGDCVTWAWIANGPVPLSFYVEGRNREIMELLGCRIAPNADGSIIPSDAYNRELRERCRRPRVEIWCEHLGIPCEPKRPTIAAVEGKSFHARRVVLCPHTHFKAREWPPAYWLDLNWELRSRNLDVCWMLETEDQQYKARGPSVAYFGYSMRDCAALLNSAAVVIANDSMPAHLAGTIGRPTLAMMGPTGPNVFTHVPDVLPMQSEITACAACHFGKPYRVACDMMCQALATVFPVDVAKTAALIVEKLNESRRVSSSLSADEATRNGNQRRGA